MQLHDNNSNKNNNKNNNKISKLIVNVIILFNVYYVIRDDSCTLSIYGQ